MREADLSITKRESFIAVSQPEYPTVPFMRGTVYAFSSATKEQIRAKTGGRCAQCGSTDHIQCHHIISQCLGGRDTIENGVPLCGGKGQKSCHVEWDNKTIVRGIAYPGVRIEDTEDRLWKSTLLKAKAIKKYKRLR